MASRKLCGSNCTAHTLTVGEGFTNPLGFHDSRPAFSWKLPADAECSQAAYQVRVFASSEDMSKPGDIKLWDSGKVASDQSVFVRYAGPELVSAQRVYWQVKVWFENGMEADWSELAWFELGLLKNNDWQAKWISTTALGPDTTAPKQIQQSGESNKAAVEKTYTPAYLRREFKTKNTIVFARLYVTAKGLYEIYLNGNRVGNDHFVPGWTSYNHRFETLTYDVTHDLEAGPNAVGAVLAEGWYAGRIVWRHAKHLFGRTPELLLELRIKYADGTSESITSGPQWRVSQNGPIRASSVYDGEDYDATREMPGWNMANFDDSNWSDVKVMDMAPDVILNPKKHAPVRISEELQALDLAEPQAGRYVFDLGQNMVGWPRLTMPVEKGQRITVRVAEMLNQDGSLYTENYRSAKCTDHYTAAESGHIDWHPTFTFHGFRYVELSGLPEGIQPDKSWVAGLVLHSDLERVGWFDSSHAKLNQLEHNIVWGQRGNFLDIPTDCPQRDERLGWTGDAEVFCPVAMFNYDCHAFFKSWLQSMRDEQREDGSIPFVIPAVLGGSGAPGWHDAATIIPWEVYVRTGDADILTDNYEMMNKAVEWYRNQAENYLIKDMKGFGDWLQPYTKHAQGDTPMSLLGNAFYAHSAEIVADATRVIGKIDDARRYAEEAAAVKAAFAKHYFRPDGQLQNAPETQTAYLVAIAFEMIPVKLQQKTAEHLVRLVHAANDHLRTGFLGTPLINRVLDQTGHSDLALTILFKETYPSWFFSINQGATTMWERWNSYSHADGFGDVGMNSFNHYAYGAIEQWMVERVAGLAPDPENPGYKHFFVQPLVGGPLSKAHAELQTRYGQAASSWCKTDEKTVFDITVPPNTTATIMLPDGREFPGVKTGKHRFTVSRHK